MSAPILEEGESAGAEGGTDGAIVHSASNNAGIMLYSNAQEDIGDFTVIGGASADGDFSYDDSTGALTVSTTNTLTIKNTDPSISTEDRIVVEDGVSANLILDGVNIRSNSGAAISMGTSSADVTITLADSSQNIVESGSNAAIQTSAKNTGITITCTHAGEEGYKCGSDCGSLKATCGSIGAGIGSAYNTDDSNNQGTIIISDGCVYAIGRGSSAAIGYSDGISKECSINITGGLVKAEGGSNSSSDMSSVPCDNDGNKLDILNIDNTNDNDLTVNGKSYQSACTYNDGTTDYTEKTISLYVPINRRAEVVLTNSSGSSKKYSYYYTNNNKFENIDGIQ